jgi:hypothetical protein
MTLKFLLVPFLTLAVSNTHAQNFYKEIDPLGRENPYSIPSDQLDRHLNRGRIEAVHAPFPRADFLIPLAPLRRFLNNEGSLFGRGVSSSIKAMINVKNLEGFYDWLGLTRYTPRENPLRPYAIPKPHRYEHENLPLGIALFHDDQGTPGLGFNCMNCHGGQILGQSVLGLPNRFPRMYHFTRFGDTMMKLSPMKMTKSMFKMTPLEFQQFKKAVELNHFTKTQRPPTLGIDTSLAQVLMSLARRAPDGEATLVKGYERKTPQFIKEEFIKPSPWWIMKYKNKFLIDGSLTAGHPLEFIILMGEVMFANDLNIVDRWVNQKQNQDIIRDVTTAIFHSKAPSYFDFYPKHSVSLERVEKGHQIYENRCSTCHGSYQANGTDSLTYKLKYFTDTPVMDVGTGSRFQTMQYAEQELSNLNFYKKRNFQITPQKGFIAQPLDGVWVRFPYLHNGSIPNLCELLKPPYQRVEHFYQGEFHTKDDMDHECVGYPTGKKTPLAWMKNKKGLFKTNRPGHSNQGHDFGTDLSSDEKKSLIEFLRLI